MSTTKITEDSLRNGAYAYNADYPEAAAEIAAGIPELRIGYESLGLARDALGVLEVTE